MFAVAQKWLFLPSNKAADNSSLRVKNHIFVWSVIIFGGMPLFLPWILWMGEAGFYSQRPISWYYWVNAVISAPHVYSTYCRLGRKISEGRVHWVIGFPAYLASAGILLYSARAGFFLEVMTAVNVWQSVHYVRQTYGVYRYIGRDRTETVTERRLSYWAFHLAMPLLVLGRWDTLFTVWSGRPSEAIIPVRMPEWVMSSCWTLLIVAALLAVALEVRKFMRQKSSYRLEGMAIVTTFFFIHLYGFMTIEHFQRGFMAVTIFHAVQYLGLVWLTETEAQRSIFKRFYFLLFWATLFFAGMAWEKGVEYYPLYAGILLGAVSLHHYFVDTLIWRRTSGT